ncbi:MAG: tripartite tricarboxylate transporter substrate binding protein [Burkholderiales bacterium]|nr:tripartite tricarboxylate transporter substrate binding protein [Burkholderiales bacterium]
MKLASALACMCGGLALGAPALDAADFPAKPVEMVASGSPGGGIDLLARSLEVVLREEKLITQPIAIKNMGGAGGNLAKTYVHQKKGDPYFLYVESNRIYTNRIVGTTSLTHADFTPIARLMTEYLVWVVRADSPFQSAKEILDRVKADPGSVTFGVGTVPSNDQLNIMRPLLAVGVDPKRVKIVTFRSGGDLMIQLLGGHVPVISTGLSEALEQVKGGKARIVSISAPNPVGGELARVPTWRSIGVDVAILHWRGLFAPPGIPAEAVKYWDQTLGRLVKSAAWKSMLEKHQWFDAYADSATFRRELDQEMKVASDIFMQLGMAKGLEKK